ncbi:SNW domain-containing protein 1 [Balamuthia mandrillaris]
MATALSAFLPRPRNVVPDRDVEEEESRNQESSLQRALNVQARAPPPYGQRQGFVPRTVEDFGDGGAFPEIHVAQYPLNMGKKSAAQQSNPNSTLPVLLDSNGKVKYEAILGNAPDKVVHSRALALREKNVAEMDLDRPGTEAEEEATAKTRAALEAIVNGKIQAARPAATPALDAQPKGPTYIRYTAQGGGGEHNSGAKDRIIRMVEMPADPLEPPKFKHKRMPPGPPSPPAPVLHSPPRKVTVEDQQAWKIPPCVSNWKNAKGYTIPLDKRLAADGRGLQEVKINDNFAALSEALYIAERKSREAVSRRAAIQKKILQHEKAEKEERLRKLAEEARKGRLGQEDEDDVEEEEAAEEELDEDAQRELREREALRYERRRERERQRHRDNYAGTKKTKAERDAERDISEKIALGEAPKVNADSMFDQRLFNQSQGLSSGFDQDDSYNVYDKPLFKGTSNNFIYRPKKGDEDTYGSAEDLERLKDTSRFKPDRGFSGVDRADQQQQGQRSGPVEFEQDAIPDDEGLQEEQPKAGGRGEDEEEDPFGLDSFITEVKASSSRKRPLDSIGKGGFMHAAGGGSRDTLSSRTSIAFAASSTSSSATNASSTTRSSPPPRSSSTRAAHDDDNHRRRSDISTRERRSRSPRHDRHRHHDDDDDRHSRRRSDSRREHHRSSSRERDHSSRRPRKEPRRE